MGRAGAVPLASRIIHRLGGEAGGLRRGEQPRRRARILASLACLLLAAACDRPPSALEPVELRFVDFLDHQTGNVTTRRISAGDGSELLGSGWRLIEGENASPEGGGQAAATELELVAAGGRLRFFSADAAARGLELAFTAPLPPRVVPSGQLNGRSLGGLKLAGDQQTYRVDFPPAAIREGWSSLWLKVSATDSSTVAPAVVRLAELRFLPAVPAPAATPRIRAGDDPGDGGFSMPGDSYLDVVAHLPEDPRWAGRFDIVFPAGRPAAVTVRAELLDAAGTLHELWTRSFETPAAPRSPSSGETGDRFRLSLRRWARQLVRLRLRVTGGAGCEVRWAGARVTGEGRGWMPPIAAADSLRTPPASGRLGRPDVFIVLLDAGRADAFGCYGARHPTPAIDDLARRGTRFANALAAAPWTGPSVPAVLSGLYPDTLGIEHWGSRLPPGVGLVQEMFRHAGYHTVLWSQHPFYRDHAALRRGFADFRRGPRGRREVLPGAEELLREDRPTFAVVHLLPPHTPYDPPAPFRGAYTADYRGSVSVDAPFLNSFPNRRDPEELSQEDRDYIFGRYLETVAFADSLVGRTVDLLKQAGRFDDALIIVLADHGEAFLEHRHFMHCRLLYGEFLRVPLVIKWPASTGGFDSVVEAPVSLVDLTPTLVDGLSLTAGGRRFQGSSLLPQAFGAAAPRRGLYAVTRGTARGRHRPRPSAAVILDGWKLVLDLESQRMELYHLASDPGERDDRAAAEPVRAELLRQLLYRQRQLNATMRTGLGDTVEQTVDPEVSRQLRALGYL